MKWLEDDIKKAEQEFGKDAWIVQQMRDQLAASRAGKSAQEIYVTGSSGPRKPPEQK